MNEAYEVALAWVKANYPHLFVPCLHSITLVKSNRFQSGADGLCAYLGTGQARITIRRRKAPIAWLASTIVHELTHATQYQDKSRFATMTVAMREDEAHAAGHEACVRYQKQQRGW